jgi:hypothetical protein
MALSPALASAAAPTISAPPADASAVTDVGISLVPAPSLTLTPRGFQIDAQQAIAVAETSPTMLAIHRVHHPLRYEVFLWVGSHYEVYFFFHGKLIGDVIVTPVGRLGPTYTGPEMLGVWARGHYGLIFDKPWVWIPFGLMFLVPLIRLRGRSWLDVLDLAMFLSWGISYVLFDHVKFELSVWLAYPPLVYLLVRMLVRGLRPRTRTQWIECRLPIAVLAAGLLALVAARIWLALEPKQIMDVGEASLVGAYKILHGQAIYYSSVGHADTYGPIAYLAYAPFEALWPGINWHTYEPAARAATITFDLVTIGALVLLGTRLRRGREGPRLGLTMAWLWAACPFSLLGMPKNTNDGLVAMLLVIMMLALSTPIRRGVWLGLAAAAKFFPAILLPLIAVGRGGEGRRDARRVLAGFVIVVGSAIAVFLPPGGIKEIWDHTIGYQLTRSDVSSPWALHPSLAPIKLAFEVGAGILALLVAFRPRGERTTAQVSALAAALIIAVQLPALHWFYFYIVWFLPLVLIAVLGSGAADRAAAGEGVVAGEIRPAELEPPTLLSAA